MKKGMNLFLSKMGTQNEIFEDVKCVSNIYNPLKFNMDTEK